MKPSSHSQTKFGRQKTILKSDLHLYNLQLGPGNYFHKEIRFVFGKLNNFTFHCLSKSGSQSLWLPLPQPFFAGLKVFHPVGFSGTLEKAKMHRKVQDRLFGCGLAPKPLSIHKIRLHFNFLRDHDWTCYGIVMKQVLHGGAEQVIKNLLSFGVKRSKGLLILVDDYLKYWGLDALTLEKYRTLCEFYGVFPDEKIEEVIADLENRLPPKLELGSDLLSEKNIVLDEYGKGMVIDCDLSSI